jgi:hypothetical protein
MVKEKKKKKKIVLIIPFYLLGCFFLFSKKSYKLSYDILC